MNAVGKQYIVSVLFRNILTCLYGNTTSNIAMSYKYPKRYQRTLIRQMSGELRLTTSIMYNKCGTRYAPLVLWVNRYWSVYDLQNLTIPSSFCKHFHVLTFTVNGFCWWWEKQNDIMWLFWERQKIRQLFKTKIWPHVELSTSRFSRL